MKLKNIIIITVILLVIRVINLKATSGASGGQFMMISPDARGSSLSGALVSSVEGVEGLYWNVAGLCKLKKDNNISISYNKWILDMNYMYGGYVRRLNLMPGIAKAGAIGIGVEYGMIGGLEGRDDSGEITADSMKVMYMGGNVGYSAEIGNFGVGIGIKFYSEEIFEESKIITGIDIGGIWNIVDTQKTEAGVGIIVKNIGYDSVGDKMPISIGIGGNYKIGIRGGHTVEGVVSSDIYINESPMINIGIEYGFKEIIFIRTGYKLDLGMNSLGWMNGLNLGIGGRYKGIGIDVGFRSVGLLGDSIQSTISYEF